MEISVLNIKGKETGRKIELKDSIFGIEPNENAVYLAIKQYLANQRQGTHKSKERADISGSTRKIKKQKGTGTARAGSIKSPTFRGGGRVFGPRPRSYSFKLNKSLKKLARKSILSDKLKSDKIRVIDSIEIEKPRTKDMISIISDLDLTQEKVLIVFNKTNKNVSLSSRNLKKVKVVDSLSLNSYDLLNATSLIFIEDSIGVINEILS